MRVLVQFIFISCAVLSSCQPSTSSQQKETVVKSASFSVKNDDAEILKKIHAKEKQKSLDLIFNNKVKTTNFNGCVLVAQQGKIIYKKAFGFKNIPDKAPLELNSAFQLASISKTLTAGAILLLKDEGKLKLTDNVKQYLPEFPYDGITIDLLLSHRSGLSNYIYFCEPFCEKPSLFNNKPFDNAAAFQIMKTVKPEPYAPPNKKFEYCNTNYALLALIVEKVSKISFADFMDQRIFKPLGMNDSWVYGHNKPHENATVGHKSTGKLEDEVYADGVVGDKGIYSTVEDLFKWDQSLYSEDLLKKETIEEAFTGHSNEHKGKRNYGYGWRLIEEGKNEKIIYHNGWWHGYSTLFFRRPSDKTTVIILANKHSGSTYQIKDVLDVLDNNSNNFYIETE